MSERLRLVKSFEELREGMVVVVKDCNRGHRRCRSMLVSRETCEDCDRDSFTALPPCHGEVDGICAEMVDAGDVFRVLDGLESSPGTAAGADRTTHAREMTDAVRK